jgi:hypothetical protein
MSGRRGERDFREWVGAYDPERFDVAYVNQRFGSRQ